MSEVGSDVRSAVASKSLGTLGYFWHFIISCICVFVNLCLCICVFVLSNCETGMMMMRSENGDVPIRQGSPDVAVGSALTFRQGWEAPLTRVDNHTYYTLIIIHSTLIFICFVFVFAFVFVFVFLLMFVFFSFVFMFVFVFCFLWYGTLIIMTIKPRGKFQPKFCR